MIQTEIDFDTPTHLRHFSGAVYDPVKDQVRLTKQIGKIYSLMSDGKWRTLREISEATGAPEASVSAQIRNIAKIQFYNTPHEKKRIYEGGTWTYRLLITVEKNNPEK